MSLKKSPSLSSISPSVITEDGTPFAVQRQLGRQLNDIAVGFTMHAVPRIITRPLFYKILWLVSLLVSMGLCGYSIATNIQDYLAYEVNTLVQVVPQFEIAYPAITVCNINPFITDAAFAYINDYYSTNYNVSVTSYSEFYDMVRRNEIPDEVDWLFYRTFDPEFDRDLRYSFGHDFYFAILMCKFKFRNCNADTINYFYHPKYGNCFVYNSGVKQNGEHIDIKTVHQVSYGLELAVFTGVSDQAKSYLYQEAKKGIVVLIEDQKTVSIDKEGVLIAPGSFADVILTRTDSTNLPLPYNDCHDQNSATTNLTLQMRALNMTYNRRNCFTLCMQKITIDKLGCYDMRYPRLYDTAPCSDKQSFEMIKSLELDLNGCESECPFECSRVSYEWTMSYSEYPTYKEFKYLKEGNDPALTSYFSGDYSYADVKQSAAGFFVYFNPFSITEITQSPSMELTDLIANIGGILGLFMGLSVLSVVEFIEMAFYAIEAAIKIFRMNFHK